MSSERSYCSKDARELAPNVYVFSRLDMLPTDIPPFSTIDFQMQVQDLLISEGSLLNRKFTGIRRLDDRALSRWREKERMFNRQPEGSNEVYLKLYTKDRYGTSL